MAKLYYASMNAGKSTVLLQTDFNYRERGMATMLYTAGAQTEIGGNDRYVALMERLKEAKLRQCRLALADKVASKR